MTTDAVPFLPPVEPEELKKGRALAVHQILEARRLTAEAMFKYVSGYDDLPPRQRFAALTEAIESWRQQQEIVGIVEADPVADFFTALSTKNAYIAMNVARDYAKLVKEYSHQPLETVNWTTGVRARVMKALEPEPVAAAGTANGNTPAPEAGTPTGTPGNTPGGY